MWFKITYSQLFLPQPFGGHLSARGERKFQEMKIPTVSVGNVTFFSSETLDWCGFSHRKGNDWNLEKTLLGKEIRKKKHLLVWNHPCLGGSSLGFLGGLEFFVLGVYDL